MKWLWLLGLSVACAAPPRPRAPVPSSPGLAPSAREAKLGREIDEAIARRIGLYGDRQVTAYVERVGRTLSGAAHHPVAWTFRVLDDPAVNAFAAPGGFVYVTRGLLAHLGSEAELAAILAHEIGHVDARHALRDEAWADQRAPGWTRADMLRFYERSRDNEREADAWSAGALARAGYAPSALADALRRLDAVERAAESSGEADEEAGWLASHPSTRARIARAEHAARTVGGRSGRQAHRAAIEGLVYGNNPRGGRLDGSRWVLPQHALAFELPTGFTAELTAGGLVAASAGSGTVLMLLAAHRDDRRESAGAMAEPRWTRVAGHRTVFGELRLDSSELRGGVAVLSLERELLMLIVLGKPDSRWATHMPELLARFHAFRQRRAPAPRRLHVARLPSPAPLSLLAVRSGVSRGELALLNGISESATLPSGAWVKLID
jgi:predicted Zn-dependent protease